MDTSDLCATMLHLLGIDHVILAYRDDADLPGLRTRVLE